PAPLHEPGPRAPQAARMGRRPRRLPAQHRPAGRQLQSVLLPGGSAAGAQPPARSPLQRPNGVRAGAPRHAAQRQRPPDQPAGAEVQEGEVGGAGAGARARPWPAARGARGRAGHADAGRGGAGAGGAGQGRDGRGRGRGAEEG
ncbi:hypothetical protein LTR16_012284, partial [Cryomyces antarcticus]